MIKFKYILCTLMFIFLNTVNVFASSNIYERDNELFNLLYNIDIILPTDKLPNADRDKCTLVVYDDLSEKVRIITDKTKLLDSQKIIGYLYDTVLFTDYKKEFSNLYTKYSDYYRYINYSKRVISD